MLGAIGGILGGLGGLGSLLGGLGIGNRNVPIYNTNQYTDPTYGQFQDLLGQSDRQFGRYMGSATNKTNQLDAVQNALGRLENQMAGVSAPGINQGFGIFNRRQPLLMDQATEAAERFTQPYGTTARAVADRRAQDAVRKALGGVAGNAFSGAASAAASRAAGDVLGDFETDVARNFANISSQLYGNAANQERMMAEQAPQQRFANIINTLMQRAGLEQSRGNSMAQQAGLYSGLAGEQGARSRQLLGGLQALSMPSYAEQVQTSPLSEAGLALGGIGDMFANPDFQNLFK